MDHPIDCTDIDQDMIYAQLKGELRYWFNAEEEAKLQENNRDFYRSNTTEDLARQLFRIPQSDEKPRLMALDELMDIARKRSRHALRGVNAQTFSRALVTAGFTRRHTREGNRYEVKVRELSGDIFNNEDLNKK